MLFVPGCTYFKCYSYLEVGVEVVWVPAAVHAEGGPASHYLFNRIAAALHLLLLLSAHSPVYRVYWSWKPGIRSVKGQKRFKMGVKIKGQKRFKKWGVKRRQPSSYLESY